ncbi:protein of unknown function [Methylocella tundrae]|uniref:Uncharacterized protein n=1 Tax=Methylocella tundrae TaxID=227605 RepID=A0A4U8Z2G8_METTU|nr:protein of unknown function [Methylocella tundrae]
MAVTGPGCKRSFLFAVWRGAGFALRRRVFAPGALAESALDSGFEIA